MQNVSKPRPPRILGRPTATGRRRPRRSSRWATDLRGIVGFPGYRLQLDCLVLDMSSGGARVELAPTRGRKPSAHDLPDIVILALPTDRVEVTGTVRWRDGAHFGIGFTSAFVPTRRQFDPDDGTEALLTWVAGHRDRRSR